MLGVKRRAKQGNPFVLGEYSRTVRQRFNTRKLGDGEPGIGIDRRNVADAKTVVRRVRGERPVPLAGNGCRTQFHLRGVGNNVRTMKKIGAATKR